MNSKNLFLIIFCILNSLVCYAGEESYVEDFCKEILNKKQISDRTSATPSYRTVIRRVFAPKSFVNMTKLKTVSADSNFFYQGAQQLSVDAPNRLQTT
jgi:hypothetical protein